MHYTLMIVDDEYEIRNGLCSYFPWEQIGFRVMAQAESGEHALELLSRQNFDVVLCDIRMPGISGLEVARTLYERHCKTEMVMFSAYRDFEYAQQAMSYGVRHYVLKSTRYQVMIEIFKKLKASLDEQRCSEPTQLGGSYHKTMLSALKSYVQQHLREATLEGAALAIGRSPSFTSRFFKEQAGQQFGEYLQSVRMQRAAELLKDIHLKTYEISEQIGYATPKSFTRTFKKRFGVAPRSYRGAVDNEEGATDE